jgi:hypothetical protein
MTLTDVKLMAILRIAHDISPQGRGLSMKDALARTGYAAYRANFTVGDVLALISAHSSLLEEWLAYSEDKRTDGGWYVLRDAEIGQVRKPSAQRSYATIEEAVAQFVVHELDFWAGVRD